LFPSTKPRLSAKHRPKNQNPSDWDSLSTAKCRTVPLPFGRGIPSSHWPWALNWFACNV